MKTKKLLSWLLVLVMVFSLLPSMGMTAEAATADTLNITVTVSSTATLGAEVVMNEIKAGDLTQYSDNCSDLIKTDIVNRQKCLYVCNYQCYGSGECPFNNPYIDAKGNKWNKANGPYTAGIHYGKFVKVFTDNLISKPTYFNVNGVVYSVSEGGGFLYCILDLGTLDGNGNFTGDYFKSKHTHDWKYSATANKLTAKCEGAEDCDVANGKIDGVSLTFTASDENYSGSAVEPTITYGKDQAEKTAWTNAGLVLPGSNVTGAPTITKTYYNTDASGNKTGTALSEAPSAVGKYIVDVKVSYGTDKEATVSLPYELIKPEYLTFTAEEANSTITFNWQSGTDVTYSTDGTEWTDYTAGTAITLANVGDTVSFKGTNVTTSNQKHFVMTGKIAASGDVTSLTNGTSGDATLPDSSCYYMFYCCTALTAAPELPATKLAGACYSFMFYGCTALTAAPKLPATELANSCYADMFRGCTALTEAPELPATAMAQNCYNSMFYGCTKLTTAPTLPAKALAKGCYESMFYGCTKLTTAPALPATALAESCYASMFRGCTALTAAPELKKVEAMEPKCYQNMFYGCTALTTAPELPATELANSCYADMFYGCTALTEAPALPATELKDRCYQYMFQGCTALTAAPELKATTLASGCYNSMFKNCTGLKVVEAKDESEATWIFPATSVSSWNTGMISGLKATGTLQTVEAEKMYKVTAAPKTSFDLRDGTTPAATVPTNPTSDKGYDFGGWYTGIDGTGTKLTGDPADGTTYYAHWTKTFGEDESAVTHTVLTQPIKVDANGIYVADSETPVTKLEGYGIEVKDGKLCLDNATVDASAVTKDYADEWQRDTGTTPCRVSAIATDLSVVLTGDNTVYGSDVAGESWALYCGTGDSAKEKTYEISGEGTLTVDSGSCAANYAVSSTGKLLKLSAKEITITANDGDTSEGIFSTDSGLEITGGTVTVTAGNADTSYGIFLLGGLTVSGGTVTVTAGTANSMSCGIFLNGGLTVTDGAITACGETSAVYAIGGITAADAIVTGATETFTSGTTTTLTQSGANSIVISFKTSVTFDEKFKPVNGGNAITFSDNGTSYDVTAPTVSVGGNALDPQPTMTYTYYQNTGSDGTPVWTPLNPNEKPTNAGSYKVVIAVSDNDPAYAGSKEYTFSIAKADVEAPGLGGAVTIDYANETIKANDGYEVSTTSGENFATGKFTGETAIDFTKTYYVRKAAIGNHNASKEASYKPQRPATPATPTSVSKTDTTVTLTVVTGCEYSRDGTTWQDSNEFAGLTAGQMYSFYQRVKVTGSSFKSASSEALSVTTKTAPASAPSVTPIVTATTVTLPENSTYEYSTDGQTWNSIREFTELTPASAFTYYVRIKGTDTAMPSQTAPVTGYTAYAMPATVGETGAVNYTDETFEPNSGYEISKSNEPFVKETLTDGKLTIEPNTTYYIRKAATTTPAVPASATISLTIPERPAAPAETAFTKTAETVANKKDGSFGGITVAMEYSTDGGTTWTSGPKTLTDLSDETVKVRYKATTEAFKSEEYSYTFTPSTAKLTVTMGETSQQYAYGAKVVKPADPKKSGYTFGGWYKDEGLTQAWNFGTDTVTGNMTLYPKWIRNNVQKAAITGNVTEVGTGAVSGATVELYLGTVKVAATVTGGDGSYVFDNVENGIYNIVVTKADGKTKTELVTVDSTGSFTADVALPTKAVSSKVEHTGEEIANAKSDISKTVVGGLDAIAATQDPTAGQTITIKLKVEPKEDTGTAAQQEIKAKAGNGKKVEFIDMSLWQITTTDQGSESRGNIGGNNNKLLTIVIPFDFTGVNVSSVTILRKHGSGNAEKLAASPNEFGEKIEINEAAGTITLYAMKFSDYAVAYAEQSTGGHGGGSYTPGHTVTSDLKSVTKVTIDGKTVDSRYYTVNGGTVYLTGEFMKTLTNGKHTVKLYDGLKVATGTITVTGNMNVISAPTGDAGLALYAALSVSSVLGMGWVGKKKRDDK